MTAAVESQLPACSAERPHPVVTAERAEPSQGRGSLAEGTADLPLQVAADLIHAAQECAEPNVSEPTTASSVAPPAPRTAAAPPSSVDCLALPAQWLDCAPASGALAALLDAVDFRALASRAEVDLALPSPSPSRSPRAQSAAFAALLRAFTAQAHSAAQWRRAQLSADRRPPVQQQQQQHQRHQQHHHHTARAEESKQRHGRGEDDYAEDEADWAEADSTRGVHTLYTPPLHGSRTTEAR